MMLLMVVSYMFAIVLVQMGDGSEIGETYFHTVPTAMKNLLIGAVFPDLGDMLDEIGLASWSILFVFLGFLFAVALTLLNLLIGVLVNIVSIVAEVEKNRNA